MAGQPPLASSLLLIHVQHQVILHQRQRDPGSFKATAVVTEDNFFVALKTLDLTAGLQTSPDFCHDCHLCVQLSFCHFACPLVRKLSQKPGRAKRSHQLRSLGHIF